MFKRNENLYLERVKKHIEKTYDGHYVNDHNIQAVDLWEAQGSLLTTARDTAEKYLMRFGKKNGENLEDLYKAIHFIIMMIHVIEKKRAAAPKEAQPVTCSFNDDPVTTYTQVYDYVRNERNEKDVVKTIPNAPSDVLFKIHTELQEIFPKEPPPKKYPHYGYGTPDYVAETAKEILTKKPKE